MPPRVLNLALALTLAVAPALAVADSTTTKTVPTCAAGDPLVIVNTQTKYYSLMPKPVPSPGTQVQATNSKVVCQSKAQAMGAKLRGQPAAEQNQGAAAPGAMKPATSPTAGATAAPSSNSNAGNGNSGPMTGASPAPAGTANAGTPPPGAPSHSP